MAHRRSLTVENICGNDQFELLTLRNWKTRLTCEELSFEELQGHSMEFSKNQYQAALFLFSPVGAYF